MSKIASRSVAPRTARSVPMIPTEPLSRVPKLAMGSMNRKVNRVASLGIVAPLAGVTSRSTGSAPAGGLPNKPAPIPNPAVPKRAIAAIHRLLVLDLRVGRAVRPVLNMDSVYDRSQWSNMGRSNYAAPLHPVPSGPFRSLPFPACPFPVLPVVSLSFVG